MGQERKGVGCNQSAMGNVVKDGIRNVMLCCVVYIEYFSTVSDFQSLSLEKCGILELLMP